uniref:F-box domain-containing protein n=1 Tax=Opuntia streptacantha TaxID=393608 RepID=A0A7C9CWB8_OPUST
MNQQDTHTAPDLPESDNHSDCISRLPDSILIEILSRLPTKIIFQSKCVSKRWRSLISDPGLGQFHTSKISSPPETTLFLRSVVNPKFRFFNFSSNFVSIQVEKSGDGSLFSTLIVNGLHPRPVEIVGSCDGLLLCSDARDLVYYLFNPITKDITAIPPSPFPCHSVGCGLICKVEGGILKLYCLVLIQRAIDSLETLNFQIYSSGSNGWRVVRSSCPGQLGRVFSEYSISPAIPYKGMLHWVHLAQGVMIVYDPLGNPDQCRFIDLPGEKPRYDMFNRVCNVCEGRIRYFEVENLSIQRHTFPGIRVWVLSDHEKGEWVLEHHVARSAFFTDDGCLKREMPLMPRMSLMPLAFSPLNKDIVYFWCAFCIVSYNVRSKRLVIEVENYAGKLLCYKDVFPFVFPHWPMSIPEILTKNCDSDV